MQLQFKNLIVEYIIALFKLGRLQENRFSIYLPIQPKFKNRFFKNGRQFHYLEFHFNLNLATKYIVQDNSVIKQVEFDMSRLVIEKITLNELGKNDSHVFNSLNLSERRAIVCVDLEASEAQLNRHIEIFTNGFDTCLLKNFCYNFK